MSAISKEGVLDLMHARGINRAEWCRKNNIKTRSFYNVIGNIRGHRRGGCVSRQIVAALRRDGLLVLKDEPSSLDHSKKISTRVGDI